jgi:hypothetical protein
VLGFVENFSIIIMDAIWFATHSGLVNDGVNIMKFNNKVVAIENINGVLGSRMGKND